MYETEKSLVNAAQTNAKAAQVTAKKLPIPARRAVSASRSGETRPRAPVASCRSAMPPAMRLYPLRASASRRAKLPNAGISCLDGPVHVTLGEHLIVADRAESGNKAKKKAIANRIAPREFSARNQHNPSHMQGMSHFQRVIIGHRNSGYSNKDRQIRPGPQK